MYPKGQADPDKLSYAVFMSFIFAAVSGRNSNHQAKCLPVRKFLSEVHVSNIKVGFYFSDEKLALLSQFFFGLEMLCLTSLVTVEVDYECKY